ncbi:MAG: alkaline phosphatase D family protein [Burkholderiaceae bacterium]
MLKRRTLITASAITGGALIVPAALWQVSRAQTGSEPFALGVASGMPDASSVVLWTRIMDVPTGQTPRVRWELADDAAFKTIVRQGTVTAVAEDAYSVHVEVDQLPAGRWFFYRFQVGNAVSPVGRTRTMPTGEASGFRIGLGSCQNYQHGYFSALGHAAKDNLDLMLWVGDYIYEYGPVPNPFKLSRLHPDGETYGLADYRARYALYKREAPLQALHAACPWRVIWDDHEVENDYADDRGQRQPQLNFLERRAAAYKAWWEHMPVRNNMRPSGPAARIYGHVDVGTLARVHLLDTRQYRSHQSCAPTGRGGSTLVGPECTERLNPARSVLGQAQEAWLRESLRTSKARYNLIVQQTLMAECNFDPNRGGQWWTDGWSGYPAARERLLGDLRSSGAGTPVVLGGDVHTHYAAELRLPASGREDAGRGDFVAAEFTCTSVSSRSRIDPVRGKWITDANPHIKYVRGEQRGYTQFELTADKLTANLKCVDDATQEVTKLETVASFEVPAGQGVLRRVS